MEIAYGRGVMQGVGNYVAAQMRSESGFAWRLYRSRPDPGILPLMKQWKPDGVSAHIATRELADRLARWKTPVINTTTTIPDWKGALIEVDHHMVGRMAAKHFLDRGFRSFGYVGSDWAGFSLVRESAFRQVIGQAGYLVDSLHLNYLPLPPTDQAWDSIDGQVIAWLQRLEKPTAIFASNDRPAREVADACASIALRVPDAVAILGVDDDEYECFLGDPPLSSICNPSEKIGRLAAETLEAMMLGKDDEPIRRMIPTRQIAVRRSSDSYAVDDPYLKSA